jgi:hypothetical protein
MSKYVEIFRKRAIEYADLINLKIAENAMITVYKRIEGNFDQEQHEHRVDKTCRTNGCHCDYCVAMNRYVRSKLVLHSLKRQLWRDEILGPYITLESLLRAIEEQEKHCKRLRGRAVKIAQDMQIPNSIKRKTKYE